MTWIVEGIRGTNGKRTTWTRSRRVSCVCSARRATILRRLFSNISRYLAHSTLTMVRADSVADRSSNRLLVLFLLDRSSKSNGLDCRIRKSWAWLERQQEGDLTSIDNDAVRYSCSLI